MSRTYILKAPGGTAFAPRRLPPQRLAGPLSNTQKAKLSMLAAKSHDLDGPLDADAHRHAECQRAVGKPGLTACTQDDYKALLAHFLNLAGESGEAFEAAVAHGTEPKRIASYKLGQALQKAGLPAAYAAKICMSKYKCALADANDRQLWKLTFDINRIAASRRRAQ